MFYAQFVLAKKGPLAKIWLAAHWEKKLTKAQIYETDVPQAIEEVIRPKVKMALRTVGHLLLGIVRIYSKKTRYLLADTNEAYIKMKVNFRDGFTFEAEVPVNADIDEDFANHVDDFNISVPEFHDADYNEKLIMANVSRLEDITLKDDVNYNAMFQINMDDDRFGDEENYGEIEQLYGSVGPASLRPTPQPESLMEMARDASIQGSVLSNHGNETIHLTEGERGPIFNLDDMDFGDDFGGGFMNVDMKQENMTAPEDNQAPAAPAELFNSMVQDRYIDEPMNDFGFEPEAEPDVPPRQQSPESFALEPLDLDNLDGARKKRQKKPRRLLVDSETMLSSDAFREQQEDFTDIVQPITLAPPTRRMLDLCVTGDLPHLMSLPGSRIYNKDLLKEYRKLLVPRKFDPNFTIAELSDSSSLTGSMERQAAPWEDLELNENIPEQYVAPGPLGDDDYYQDFDLDMGDYGPPPIDLDGTLGDRHDVMDFDQMPGPADPMPVYGENKENEGEEEDWSDPFGSVSRKGRLESYGFGSVKKTLEDEGKWVKRANQILKQISLTIETTGQAEFSTIVSSAKNRKQAAEQFYSLLSLAKSHAISVEQEEPYGEIIIRAGENFHEALNPPPKDSENSIMRTPMRAI